MAEQSPIHIRLQVLEEQLRELQSTIVAQRGTEQSITEEYKQLGLQQAEKLNEPAAEQEKENKFRTQVEDIQSGTEDDTDKEEVLGHLQDELIKTKDDLKKEKELRVQLEYDLAEFEKVILEDARYREQLKKENSNHELTLRHVHDTNGQREGESLQEDRRRSELVCSVQTPLGEQKYNLFQWRYPQLRDTINTSCNIELLEACGIEVNRRLKIYHTWKAKNKRRSTMDVNEYAPHSVINDAAKAVPQETIKTPINTRSQRYFRIPLIRPPVSNNTIETSDPDVSNNRGWWYAHFDGQYVAREIELHPDKPAILLVSGIDDMQMCPLSLDETGLSRKPGAEILEHEFNSEWEKYGDAEYHHTTSQSEEADC